jgi:phage N-6-adenine-methyltransferase
MVNKTNNGNGVAALKEAIAAYSKIAATTKADKNRLGYVGAKPGVPKRDSDSWYTPDKYLKQVREVLHGIDLDPFSSERANQRVVARRFFTAADDGFKQKWKAGTVFMNPPYSGRLCKLAVRKFIDEFTAGNFTDGILLVNNATETEWFQLALSHASAVCFTNHRISFLNDDNKHVSGNTRGQAFLFFGRRTTADRFMSVFNSNGIVLRIP